LIVALALIELLAFPHMFGKAVGNGPTFGQNQLSSKEEKS
jgi:hypothetical protein